MGGEKIKTRQKKMSRRGQKYTTTTQDFHDGCILHTDNMKGGCDKAPRQQKEEECLPVMKEKRWKKGRKRRRERGR